MREAREVIAEALKSIQGDVKPCPRCDGIGYHHGFGEAGHDPDWCENCGGSTFVEKYSEDEAPEAILTALSSAGMAVVPVEPTETMHNAARDWSLYKYGKPIGKEASDQCYRIMIAAALPPLASGGG